MEKIKDVKALSEMGQVFIMVPDRGNTKYRVTPLENVECDFNDRQIRRRLGYSWEVIKNSPVKGIYGTLDAMQRSSRVSFNIKIKDSDRVWELEEAIAPKCCKCSKMLHVQEDGRCFIELRNGFQYGENAMVDIGVQEGVEDEITSDFDPEKEFVYNKKSRMENHYIINVEKRKKLFYNNEWIYSSRDYEGIYGDGRYFHRDPQAVGLQYVFPILSEPTAELTLSYEYNNEEKAAKYINSPKGYFVQKLLKREVKLSSSSMVRTSDDYASEDTYYTSGPSTYFEDTYEEPQKVDWQEVPEVILKDMRWILQDLGRRYTAEEEREEMNEKLYLRSIEDVKARITTFIEKAKEKKERKVKEKKSWISDYI